MKRIVLSLGLFALGAAACTVHVDKVSVNGRLPGTEVSDADAGTVDPGTRGTPGAPTAEGDGGTSVGDDAGSSRCSNDLTTDSANCGVCGHSCLGGACLAGTCQPVSISNAYAQTFTLDGTNLITSTDGSLLRYRMGSETTPQVLSTGHVFFWAQSDGLDVFGAPASSPASLYRVPVEGGALVSMMAPSVYEAGAIAVDATHVYMIGIKTTSPSGSTFEGALLALPKGAVGATPTVLLSDSSAPSLGDYLVADATHVFYTRDKLVYTYATNGDATQHYAIDTFTDARGFVADGDAVYLLDYQHAIHRIPKAQPAQPTMVTTASTLPADVSSGLAVDASHVYWNGHGAKAIYRAPKTGGAPVKVAPTGETVGHIAVDAAAIYWTDEFGMFRLAK